MPATYQSECVNLLEMIEFCAPRACGAEWQLGAALAGFAGAGFELGSASLCLLPFPSHQTTKFPPTPSNRSTSASHVRMIKLQYYSLTVINNPATIACDSPPPHVPAFLPLTIHCPPLTIFLCVHAGTAANPIPSYVYFTTCGYPGVGVSGTGFSLCSFIAPTKIHPRLRSPPRIFRGSWLQPRH
jgi:hypothetical protein